MLSNTAGSKGSNQPVYDPVSTLVYIIHINDIQCKSGIAWFKAQTQDYDPANYSRLNINDSIQLLGRGLHYTECISSNRNK